MLCCKIIKSQNNLKLKVKTEFQMYGENTNTMAIPIYRVLPYPVTSTLHMRALRANVKPAHCKFKGRTFSANFLPLLAQQTPVFFPQPAILALGRCQRLLNLFLYGHLHMKQQPRYAFSTVNRTLYGRVALL